MVSILLWGSGFRASYDDHVVGQNTLGFGEERLEGVHDE